MFVDPHTEVEARLSQTPGQLGRVDQRHAIGVVATREVGRRVHQRLGLLAVQQDRFGAVLREELGELGQLGYLPVLYRNVQFSRYVRSRRRSRIW